MKEIKVRVYGRWTSYTCMKQKKKISCNCFNVGRGLKGRDDGDKVTNV
jgi:hypothetical protein